LITVPELKRIASKRGYSLGVIEKDYALTWVLRAISDSPALSKGLVFKGGTCLSKVYVECREYLLNADIYEKLTSRLLEDRDDRIRNKTSALVSRLRGEKRFHIA